MTSAARRQPANLAEALHWLSLTSATPTHFDTGRVAEMSGIQSIGGRLIIGLNTTPADLSHSSLIRSEAACLAEAARSGHNQGIITLAAGLTPTCGMALALVALAAEIELTRLRPEQAVERSRRSILPFLQEPPAPPALAVAVHLDLSDRVRGSAFVPAPAVRGASASLQAAAAGLRLDADGIVREAVVAVLPQSGPLFEVEVAPLLLGQPIDPHRIAAAAQRAQVSAQTFLGPALISAAFPVHVAAHLVRKALDRAAARCLALLEAES